MRTWWLWASVVALCVSPTLAEARERARERGDGRGRHSSWDRRTERGQRDRGASRRDRSDRRDRPRSSSAWNRGDSSSRGRGNSDRGWTSRRNEDGRSRSYRPSRSFRYAPRYPSYSRHGYYQRHGYYFPRYYYDYDSYTTHASVRVLVEPEETEVYVDGYYAGIVDNFDGIFQRLNLTPGGHEITLRLDGHRTWSAEIYAEPGSTVNLHHDMTQGAGGPEIEEYSNEGE